MKSSTADFVDSGAEQLEQSHEQLLTEKERTQSALAAGGIKDIITGSPFFSQLLILNIVLLYAIC